MIRGIVFSGATDEVFGFSVITVRGAEKVLAEEPVVSTGGEKGGRDDRTRCRVAADQGNLMWVTACVGWDQSCKRRESGTHVSVRVCFLTRDRKVIRDFGFARQRRRLWSYS